MTTIVLAGPLLWLAACSTIPRENKPEPVVIELEQPDARSPQPIRSAQTQGTILDADELARRQLALLESSDDVLDGNEIGYYVDVLEARLIQQVRDSSVSMTREGNIFTLLIGGSQAFDSNRSRLKSGIKDTLSSITSVLEEYRNIQISIFGHTDDIGDAEYNQKLSEWRAQSVARYLTDGGVAAKRITIIGYGESQPRATNETAEGRGRNRRIELLLAPMAR